jgi:hypothetical protein
MSGMSRSRIPVILIVDDMHVWKPSLDSTGTQHVQPLDLPRAASQQIFASGLFKAVKHRPRHLSWPRFKPVPSRRDYFNTWQPSLQRRCGTLRLLAAYHPTRCCSV